MNDCSELVADALTFTLQPANDESTPKSIMRLFWLVCIFVLGLCAPGASYLESLSRVCIMLFIAILTSELLGSMLLCDGLPPARKSP